MCWKLCHETPIEDGLIPVMQINRSCVAVTSLLVPTLFWKPFLWEQIGLIGFITRTNAWALATYKLKDMEDSGTKKLPKGQGRAAL